MKKLLVLTVLMTVCLAGLYAQAAAGAATPAPGTVQQNTGSRDAAQQKLKEVSVSKFEDAGFWVGSVPSDHGIVSIRRQESLGAKDKQPIPAEVEQGFDPKKHDIYVLGAKVEFFRRTSTSFSVMPLRPIPVEGVSKTISVWAVGRSYNHLLKVIIEDIEGNVSELTLGKLNFTGWEQLTVAVPPHIPQVDSHYRARVGIKILGFRIDTDMADTYGTYYFYLDDLRVVTDLYPIENRDEDDMLDNW